MPELPDLTILREYLEPRIVGVSIDAALVRRPIIVRNLLGGDVAEHLVGRRFASVGRRGKFLLLPLDDGNTILINPMLAGRVRYGPRLSKHRKRDALVLILEDGNELRYYDGKDMGKVYLAHDLARVPTFSDQGPEANDPALTLDRFAERWSKERGETKEILVRQTFVAGIGNAYADEICWRAEVYPFRKGKSLSDAETSRLFYAMRDVLAEAIQTLRERLGERAEREIRDFLSVHGKPGQPCPRCGSPISEVKRVRRATHFCRTCQPGLILTSRKGS